MAAVAARLLLAGIGALLVEAALRKAGNRHALAAAVASWRFVPADLRPVTASALLRGEILAGSFAVWAAVFGQGIPIAGVTLAVLFAVFAAVQAGLWRLATDAECGCFGSQDRVSPASIARRALLGILAVACVVLMV